MSIQEIFKLPTIVLYKLPLEYNRIMTGVPIYTVQNQMFQLIIFKQPDRYDDTEMPENIKRIMEKQLSAFIDGFIKKYNKGLDVDF